MKSHLKKEHLSLSYIVYGDGGSAKNKKKALRFLEELDTWTKKQGFEPDPGWVKYNVDLGMITAMYNRKD